MFQQANGGKSTPGKNSIEKTYQKKSQLEHILLRPDTYIGSVELTKETTWVYDAENKKMIQKEISYVPGKAHQFKFKFYNYLKEFVYIIVKLLISLILHYNE